MRTTPANRIEDFTARGWWGEATLASLFDEVVAACPDRLALVDQFNRSDFSDGAAQRLSFAAVAAGVDNLAAQLHAHGIGQGDVVVVQLPNVAELAMLYLAAAKLGIIVSPTPVQYGLHELGKIRQEVAAKAFITVEHCKGAGLATGRGEAFAGDCVIFSCGRTARPGAIALDFERADAGAAAALQKQLQTLEASANDIFTICWTSGTTGQPKGVPRSHNMWLSSAWATFDCVHFRDGDVMLNPFPMINMAGIAAFLFNWLLSRTTLVLHHPLDLGVFLQQIEREGVTYTIAPPAILTMLLKQPELLAAADLSSIRVIGSGGAPLSPWMVREWQQQHDIVVINIFGSNEGMTLISGHDDVPDPEQRAEFFPRFGVPGLSWSNRAAGRMRSRLQDLESGQEITEPGRPGELLIWGASVFDGYFNAAQADSGVFTADGYFHTGDMFEIAGDGKLPQFYRFVGRCKDIIVRGGVKISPDELDSLLAGHPGIAEAAVVGYPDPVMEERICAVVVPKPGASLDLEGIIDYLKQKNVAVFKLPERLLTVAQLPRNPLGKVLRGRLKELLEAEARP